MSPGVGHTPRGLWRKDFLSCAFPDVFGGQDLAYGQDYAAYRSGKMPLRKMYKWMLMARDSRARRQPVMLFAMHRTL